MKRTRNKKYQVLFVTFMILFMCAGMVYAAGQSSANYIIESDVISAGGGDGSSTNYFIEHTTGQSLAIGDSSSSNYTNYAGSWNTIVSGTVSGFLGDINEDGSVDIRDVILVLRIAMGLDPFDPCADINGDGKVDISDVILTLRMALGLDSLQECTD